MKKIGHNAGWSFLEFVILGILQFATFRIVIQTLGIKELGIWALLISATQFAKVFDPGIAAGGARALATSDDPNVIGELISASLWITVPLYLIVLALGYFPVRYLLSFSVEASALSMAQAFLVYSMGAYFTQVIAGIFATSVNGLHFGYRKSQINIMGALVQVGLTWVLAPRLGLAGLGLAQIANNVVTVGLFLALLRYALRLNFRNLVSFRRERARKVLHLGLGIQGTSLIWTAFEISVRLLMSHFGGVAQVGFYEMAYRFASQIRLLAVYIGQSVSPTLANLAARNLSLFRTFYQNVYSVFALCAAAAFLIGTAASPLISFLMLGNVNHLFLYFSFVALMGSVLHMCMIPSELAAIAFGVVRGNLAGMAATLFALVLLGPLAGHIAGGPGVAATVLVSICIGVTTTIFANSRILLCGVIPRFSHAFDLAKTVKNIGDGTF